MASVPGVLTLIQAADTLQILGRQEMGEAIYATPALARDGLYLRTVHRLYALGR